MKVFITFDVEVWCGAWSDLDARFPAAFRRYVYGSSRHGNYALPKTLEMLNEHGLKGVFFVEPLFAARFGIEPLREIVGLIRSAGHEVQLHLHPEWTDETDPPLVQGRTSKEPNLASYSLSEQMALIAKGLELLRLAKAPPVRAFRAGNYACNQATYVALRRNGICVDSSYNPAVEISGSDLPAAPVADAPRMIEGVNVLPVTTFTDGVGRRRFVQVGGCSTGELTALLERAHNGGRSCFVIVSHGFEMLRRRDSLPDPIAVSRFHSLCRFLDTHRGDLETSGFDTACGNLDAPGTPLTAPLWATSQRLIEQGWRKMMYD